MLCRESEDKMASYVVVGGGWLGDGSSGEKFIRLKFLTNIEASAVLTMWKNKFKNTDKHPDYKIYASVKDDKNPKEPVNGFPL